MCHFVSTWDWDFVFPLPLPIFIGCYLLIFSVFFLFYFEGYFLMWLPVSVECTGLHSLVSFLPHFSFLDFFPLWKLEIKYYIF